MRAIFKKIDYFCFCRVNAIKGSAVVALVLVLASLLSMTVAAAENNSPVFEEDYISIYADTQQNADMSGSMSPADMAEGVFDYSGVIQSVERLLFGLDVTYIVETVTKALHASSIRELFALGKNLYKRVVDYALGLTGNQALSETVGNALDVAEKAVNESDTGNSAITQQPDAVFNSQKDITGIFGVFTNLLNSLAGMFEGA